MALYVIFKIVQTFNNVFYYVMTYKSDIKIHFNSTHQSNLNKNKLKILYLIVLCVIHMYLKGLMIFYLFQ